MLAHIVEEQTEMPYQTMKRFMLLPIIAPRLFNADFKKHAKRFNVLRDNKLIGALRGLFGRKSRKQVSEKEAADLTAIQQHRVQRDTTNIASELSAPSPATHDDPFAKTSAVKAAEAAAHMAEEDAAAETDSPELLAGAAFFLSACLKSLSESETAEADKSRKVEALVNAALDLIRQPDKNTAS